MKKIYLILAHKNPHQLERQINALYDEQSVFFIHLDLNSDINLFGCLNKISNVYLIKERIDCIWGDFSIVRATINLIENAIKNHDEGFCILMSGNDYIIKSKSFINSFLNLNNDKVFIDLQKAENVWSDFNQRIEYYRINLSSKKGNFLILKGLNNETFKHFIKNIITFNQFISVSFKKRKLNTKMKFYGGTQWWAMNISDLNKVNDFIKENKLELFDFFKYSHVPDEFFFHSIIMHLKEQGHPIKIENSLTYVNWSRKNCELPVTFKSDDFDELIEQPSNKLFARKFDIEFDKEILNKIDENIS